MGVFIAWCGFLGGWLLVVGPVWQAAVELRGEEFERERLRPAIERVGPFERLSPWWWLLPPAAYLINRRRRARFRHDVAVLLPEEDYMAAQSFVDKSWGWLLVAAGGLLVAIGETDGLAEASGWPDWVALPLVLFMIAVALAHTVVRLQRTRRVKEHRRSLRAQRRKRQAGTERH